MRQAAAGYGSRLRSSSNMAVTPSRPDSSPRNAMPARTRTVSWWWWTTTSILPTWIKWCGRCARASIRAKASRSCAAAGAPRSTPWPMAATTRAMRAWSSMPADRGRGATVFRAWRARARSWTRASAPNGHMCCREAKRRGLGFPRELEQARASLIDRSSNLAETLKARETSLAHAEEKIKSLADRMAEIEADAAAYRSKAERRIDELSASLQRERVELAVAQGALETTRR